VLDAANNLSRVTPPVTDKSQVKSLTDIFPETDKNPSAKSQIPIFLQIFSGEISNQILHKSESVNGFSIESPVSDN